MRSAVTLLAVGLLAQAVPACAATCDGRADAAPALNALLARGGTVRLPAGICPVSGTLLIGSDTTLLGAGAQATVIKAMQGGTYPVLQVGGPTQATGARGVTIADLGIDGSARGHGARRADGILVRFASSAVRIARVDVHDAGDNGIEDNGSDVEIADSFVHDNQTNGIYVIGKGNRGGLHVVRATDVRVLRNRVAHNSRAKAPGSGHAWDGIDIDPITQGCTVSGNTVIGNDIILFENGQTTPYSGGDVVEGNTILDSPGNGIDVEGPIADFSVRGNRIERTVGWGIVVNGPVRHGVVQGNVILGTTLEGILVKNTTPEPGAPTDVAVIDNTIETGPAAGRRAAIAARQGATGLRIEGNRIEGVPAGLGGPGPIDLSRAAPGAVVQDNR